MLASSSGSPFLCIICIYNHLCCKNNSNFVGLSISVFFLGTMDTLNSKHIPLGYYDKHPSGINMFANTTCDRYCTLVLPLHVICNTYVPKYYSVNKFSAVSLICCIGRDKQLTIKRRLLAYNSILPSSVLLLSDVSQSHDKHMTQFFIVLIV